MKKNIKAAVVAVLRFTFCNKLLRSFTRTLANGFNLFYTYFVTSEVKSKVMNIMIEYPATIKGGKYISIGESFSARSRLRIEAWDFYGEKSFQPEIIIGRNVICNFDCHIGSINKIQIGDNVLIGSRVLITDHSHGEIVREELNVPACRRNLYSKGPVIVGDNVWIGEGVSILPNVKIGNNAIIGANSVVNKDVPENCVVGGIPARVLRTL